MPQAREPCQLQQDLSELVAMIDTDAVSEVMSTHRDDPVMQEVLSTAGQPEFEAFALWMEAQCVDLRPYLNAIRDFLELPPVPWSQVGQRSGGVAAFWDDLREVLDLSRIYDFAQQKYAASPDFAAFIENLRGPEAQALYHQMAANETFQSAVAQLEAYGIDIQLIRDTLQSVLGW